jgi:hypothetical protein
VGGLSTWPRDFIYELDEATYGYVGEWKALQADGEVQPSVARAVSVDGPRQREGSLGRLSATALTAFLGPSGRFFRAGIFLLAGPLAHPHMMAGTVAAPRPRPA